MPCRLQRADRDIILYTGIAQAVLAAWAVLLSVTAGSQPIIASACVGAGGNIMKLFRIFPPASGGVDGPGDEKKQGALAACSAAITCRVCSEDRLHLNNYNSLGPCSSCYQ